MHYRLCYTSISLARSLYPESAEMSTAFSGKPPISPAQVQHGADKSFRFAGYIIAFRQKGCYNDAVMG
jgi:hypothetical protein